MANFRLSDQDQDVHRAVDAGVESGVRARNVSWGSCLQWPSTYDWKWKTVEFFCPITCSWAAREVLREGVKARMMDPAFSAWPAKTRCIQSEQQLR